MAVSVPLMFVIIGFGSFIAFGILYAMQRTQPEKAFQKALNDIDTEYGDF